MSRLKSLVRDLLPPLLLRSIRPQQNKEEVEARARDTFYSSLLPKPGLIFDVGANVGNRTASFRRLGHRVIAIEPQAKCYEELSRIHGADPQVVLVKKAIGRNPGTATMLVSNISAISTLSRDFIAATSTSGRFDGVTWENSESVEVTTLDLLIAEHGEPDFVKIDVEGFEAEVIAGLSRPLKLISLEWTPELTGVIRDCVARLGALGPIEFNISWEESMRMSRSTWFDGNLLDAILETMQGETYLFADIYIRSTGAA
jgi:FkbM family methyltransferase